MRQTEIDKNFLAVVAVEGYAEKHHLPEEEVYKEFSKYNILPLVREEYEALHTQPLEETVGFSLKNPQSEMWAESAQFIADDFLRDSK